MLAPHNPGTLIESGPCRHCARPVGFHLHGTRPTHHLDNGALFCAPGGPTIAEAVPACPKCGGAELTWTREAWGNAVSCQCGHREFHSIGD